MRLLATVLLLWAAPGFASCDPLIRPISFQGDLRDAGVPANGLYDFEFDVVSSELGTPIGTLQRPDLAVVGGRLATSLDLACVGFSAPLSYVKIAVRVRRGSSTGAYTALQPPTELRDVPRAYFASGVSGYVHTGNLAAGAVGTDQLAANAVLTTRIAPGTIASDRFAFSLADITSLATGLAEASGLSGGLDAGAASLSVFLQRAQARVSLICPERHYLRGIQLNGSARCEPLPRTTIYSVAP
jgi:hypothetical protein